MDKKIEKQIFFGLLILVITFFSLSQITPWATVNYEDRTLFSFYSWGGTTEIPTSENSENIGLYITGLFDMEKSLNEIPREKEEQKRNLETFYIGFFILFVTWIVVIMTIIFSVISFDNLIKLKNEEMKKNIATASVLSIFGIILFYLTINFLIMNPIKNMSGSIESFQYYIIGQINLQYSIGFILFLLGLIIVSGLQIYIISKKFSREIQQPIQQKTKYCRNCGEQITFNNKFCSKCGNKF